MPFQTIITEIQDGVMTLTLNRPDRLNAFNRLMMDEMIAALDMADADDAVRAIIVTGAGRGFCAGVDLSEDDAFTAAKLDPATTDPAAWDNPANRDMGGMLALRLFNCLKLVPAAPCGHVAGAGMVLHGPRLRRGRSPQGPVDPLGPRARRPDGRRPRHRAGNR